MPVYSSPMAPAPMCPQPDNGCPSARWRQRHAVRVNELLRDVHVGGHAVRTIELLSNGCGRRAIARAVERGQLMRVCRGWVATREASQHAIVAIANRGKLTGASALATLGIWDADDKRVHVQLPAHCDGSRRMLLTPIAAFTPPRFAATGFVRHWMRERAPDGNAPAWRASVIDALLVVAAVSSAEQFVACVDSAIHLGELSRAGLPILESLLPERMRPAMRLVNGYAESGLETLARLRLGPFARTIRVQVKISGIGRFGGQGRVDLLIDGWLVIELDGDEFHDPAADRKRNALLVRLGYRIHRFGYDQVMDGWPEVEATVLELLRYPPRRVRR